MSIYLKPCQFSQHGGKHLLPGSLWQIQTLFDAVLVLSLLLIHFSRNLNTDQRKDKWVKYNISRVNCCL